MGRSNSESQDGIHKEINEEISDSEELDSEPYSEALAVSSLVTIVVIAYSEEVKDHAYSIAVETTIHPQ